MRQLTFGGFLKQYVSDLSGLKTESLYKLTAQAAEENPRLREPLYLYAVSQNKVNVLLAAAKRTSLYPEYQQMSTRFSSQELMAALQRDDATVRVEYRKVWSSFQVVAGKHERETETKELIRLRVLKLKQEKGVSVYRICKDNRLNNANLNDWLKNGHAENISLNTARIALSYIERC